MRSIMAAAEKISHLLELADSGPSLRAALAEEVADLLAAWPPDYPDSMRQVCETLLVKAVRDLDPAARAKLRIQLYSQPGLVQRILLREGGPQALIEAARSGRSLVEPL